MRATYQSSSSYQSSSQGQQGSAARGATTTFGAADSKAEREAFLKYAYGDSDALVISGSSDWGILEALREAIIKLKTDFFSRSGSITIKTE